MKYFKTNPEIEDFPELTVSTFERETEKKAPFYQTIDGSTKYFAYCPGCNNPITIINLYNDKRTEENGKNQSTHGRHYPYPLKDFPPFNQDKYINCPFSKPLSFAGKDKRGIGKDSAELVNLLVTEASSVFSFCRNISGINFSENLFEKMMHTFSESDGIYYRYVNKFNLPYAFLYMSHNVNIVNQFVMATKSNPIEIAIRNKSEYFCVNQNRISFKDTLKTRNDTSMYMYFTDHKCSVKDDEPYHKMTQIIKERSKDKTNVILERTIEFDNYIFYRTIQKNRRIIALAKNIFKI